MGGASLFGAGQLAFPRMVIEAPCLYENIYPGCPGIPMWLSKISFIGWTYSV